MCCILCWKHGSVLVSEVAAHVVVGTDITFFLKGSLATVTAHCADEEEVKLTSTSFVGMQEHLLCGSPTTYTHYDGTEYIGARFARFVRSGTKVEGVLKGGKTIVLCEEESVIDAQYIYTLAECARKASIIADKK